MAFSATTTNGTQTTNGAYTVITCLQSDTLVCSGTMTGATILLIGGGGSGGGGEGGGGGAGGLLSESGVTLTGSMSIVVGGGGGAASGVGNNGVASTFAGYSATGGGGGGAVLAAGVNGGCGSGAGAGTSNSGGTGSIGFNGGDCGGAGASGGGGGNGAVGGNSVSNAGGNGGIGVSSSITGAATYYGGGGGGYTASGGAPTGGQGGGGAGTNSAAIGGAGTTNTGGGGGAGGSSHNGGAGGSGILIISYLTPPTPAAFSGETDAVSTVTGSLSASSSLNGLATVVSVVTGTVSILSAAQNISGTCAVTSSVVGRLSARALITTRVDVASTLVGSLNARALLSVRANPVSTVAGTVTVVVDLSGEVDIVSIVVGALSPLFTGEIDATSTVSGLLSAQTFLHGRADILSAMAGVVVASGGVSALALLIDAVTGDSVAFLMNPDWQPIVHEEGSLQYPIGDNFAWKLTDGTKGIGGRLTIATTSNAQDAIVKRLMQSVNELHLSLPTGDSWPIMWNPATDRKGASPFSYMNWQPVNTWTAEYVQTSGGGGGGGGSNFTVTFDANGGTGSMSPETYSTPTALTTNSFIYTGYTFNDWNTAADGSGASFANGATYPFTANVTLYAQWTAVGSIYPSGFAPPPVPGGMTLSLFDDFTGTALDPTKFDGAYDGVSHAVYDGCFLATHLVMHGDSILNLQGYQDPAGCAANTNYPAGLAASVLNWAGAGVETTGTGWLPGTRILTAVRSDSLAGLTAIGLTIGKLNWPPELDWLECNAPMTGFTATAIYGSGISKEQYASPTLDLTHWIVLGVQWTASTIEYLIQTTPTGPLTVWKSFANPDNNYSDVNSLVQPMKACLQFQTGDPLQSPVNSPGITSANPIQQEHDWIQICTTP